MIAADQAAALARLEVRATINAFDGTYDVAYRGLPVDLIGLGICDAATLAPGQRGRLRVTAAGIRFSRTSPDRQGRQRIRFHWVPAAVAESMPGVPRTWRSTVAPLLELTDEQRQAFEAEGGLYRERGVTY